MVAKEIVDTLDDNLPEAEPERHCDILGDVKAEALADPLAVTVAERGAETFDETNSYSIEEAVANRLSHTSAICRPGFWSKCWLSS